MKIAYLITRSDSIGGAQRHLLDLSKGQQRLGNEVTVLVGGNGPFVEELNENRIEVIPLKELRRSINPFRDVLAFMEIREKFRSIKPDLVSAHSSKAGFLGRLAAKHLKIPSIFTVHGWAFSGGSNPPARCLYWLSETTMGFLSTKIITVSDYDYRLGLKWAFINPARIVRIHNGIPDVGQPLRANPATESVNIISVARFESPKDHALLIEALKELRDTETPWRLRLVGDGPERPRIEKLVEGAGLAPSVEFLGYRADVDEMLAESQLFILASRKEGLPLTILEAMRGGLPVIASDVGGIAEAVIDGETGYLVPESNADMLRARIERLLKSPELREEMGRRGRERYEELFTLDRMIMETTKVYESVLLGSSEHLPDRADQNGNVQRDVPM